MKKYQIIDAYITVLMLPRNVFHWNTAYSQHLQINLLIVFMITLLLFVTQTIIIFVDVEKFGFDYFHTLVSNADFNRHSFTR